MMSGRGETNGRQDVVILSGARTPIGRILGALASQPATALGAAAVRAAIERAGIDPALVDEVIMGQVVQAGAGQAPARQAALGAGLPETVSATTINKVCGSGLKAVMMAATAIRAGEGDIFVAGGMESMSQAPYLVPNMRSGHKFGHTELVDANIRDGLWCSFEHWMMGEAGEVVADEFEVTREQMDRFALESHQKAVRAMDAGAFEREITPVVIQGRQGETVVMQDEGPRRDTSLEALAKLRPAFRPDGRITAGNAPGLNDGAAALVLASRERAEALGLKPIARIVAQGQAAVEPRRIFTAPAKAMPIVLERAGWTLDDVDLIELNEAFAAQVIANARDMEQQGHRWDWSKVNVNGGAIALGHPVGCSGARVLVTLLHALEQRGLKRGLAALCLGGGEAVSVAVEMEP
ncbi:MAG TPA: acetyl-CoA C-acetyltransferase [Aggregatilineales bacterium]|nr:acetyl-CoA C-acetyltransferase [Aggregatilineales bacterium]HQA67650.1 acetyl-CoA C-acetyltransferase [Aggregatilineales bacterium]